MMTGGLINPYEDVDGFLVDGDSIAAGLTSHSDSTQPDPGTAFEFDRNTNTVLPFGTGAGITGFSFNKKSPWAKFCKDYYETTGRRACIINRAASSSTISPATSVLIGNDWQTSGTNYNTSVTAANACLTILGKTRLKGILVIAGINDAQSQSGTGSLTVAQISGYLSTFIDNLRTDFGTTVPIYFCQIGRYVGVAISSRINGIRNAIKSKGVTYSNYEIAASMTGFAAGALLVDGIHPTATGNDHLGSMFCRPFKNATYTKWARTIIGACHFSDISTTLKNKIETWLTAWQTLYLSMDAMFILKAGLKLDTLTDWSLISGPESDGGFTFNANADIRTGTTSTVFRLGYNQNVSAINVLTNDYGVEIKATVVTTASGTLAGFVGVITTGPTRATMIRQLNPSGVNYGVLSGTSFTDAGEVNLVAGSWIFERTSSTNINLRQDGTVVDNQTDSSVGAAIGDQAIGAVAVNGVLSNPIDAQFVRYLLFKPSLVSNYTTFEADLDTLQS